MLTLTRRGLGAASLAALGGHARAQARTLPILSHRVHQGVLTSGPAGDQTAAWRAAAGAEPAWTTLDIGPLQDRLFREASLPATEFGVGFLLNSRATPAAATLFEPLGPWQSRQPIEAWDDMAPGLVQAMTIGGNLMAVPFRHATNGLFYNEALLEERGIAAPPRSLEELVDQAKRLSFRRDDGQPVAGMALSGQLAAFPVMFARAFGGDFITADFKVIPNRDAMIRALTVMQDLFAANALPRNYAAFSNEDQVSWLLQGRAAFAILPFSRVVQLNRADQSRYPGRIKVMEFPMSTTAPAGTQMAAVVEFWSMAIPRQAPDKALAWSFINAMSTKAATLGAARNGNGPVRVSAYADPAFANEQPAAAREAAALTRARPPFPAFPEASRAEAVFVEEVQAAVLGRKTPAQAVDETVQRVRAMVPG